MKISEPAGINWEALNRTLEFFRSTAIRALLPAQYPARESDAVHLFAYRAMPVWVDEASSTLDLFRCIPYPVGFALYSSTSLTSPVNSAIESLFSISRVVNNPVPAVGICDGPNITSRSFRSYVVYTNQGYTQVLLSH